MIAWLRERRNHVAAVLIATLLLLAGLGAVYQLDQERQRAQEGLRTGSWIAVQAETEALRLMEALAAVEAGAVEDKRELLLRFELFWSRIPLMMTGSESQIIGRIGQRDTVAGILRELSEFEPRLKNFAAGDGSYAALRQDLDRIRDRLHEIVLMVLGHQNVTADMREIAETYSAITLWFVVAVLSGGALFILLMRQLRRSGELLAQARWAAVQADRSAAQASEASRAKSRFLAAASHDLRQPLNAAGLLLGALRARLANRENADLAAKIAFVLDRMGAQLNTYLDLTKLDTGVIQPEAEPVPVQALFDSLAPEITQAAGRKGLSIGFVRSSAWVLTDPTLLERVLLNLLTNAVRYTEKGGVLVGCRRRGDRLRIDVIDTGPGIPEDQQERIFQEFYQIGNAERASDAGYGLGLSIVQRTLRLLNHRLELDSVPGRGSRFSVWLPTTPPRREVLPARPGNRGAARPAPPAPVMPFKVLVIEDDALVADSLVMLIRTFGYSARSAPSAEAARVLVAVERFRPDFIAADYRLPGGCNGIQAIAALRDALGRAVPAALLTGDAQPEVRAAAERACLPYVEKPVTPERLEHLLATVLAGQRRLSA